MNSGMRLGADGAASRGVSVGSKDVNVGHEGASSRSVTLSTGRDELRSRRRSTTPKPQLSSIRGGCTKNTSMGGGTSALATRAWPHRHRRVTATLKWACHLAASPGPAARKGVRSAPPLWYRQRPEDGPVGRPRRARPVGCPAASPSPPPSPHVALLLTVVPPALVFIVVVAAAAAAAAPGRHPAGRSTLLASGGCPRRGATTPLIAAAAKEISKAPWPPPRR